MGFSRKSLYPMSVQMLRDIMLRRAGRSKESQVSVLAIMVLSTLLILSSFSSILILGLADADEFEPKYIHLSWARNDVYHTITIVWWTKYWTWSKVYYDTVPHEDIKDYAHAVSYTHLTLPTTERV